MLVLRLQRTGKKGQPNFRIVLQEHTDAVKGKAKEVLGFYQPASDPSVFKVDLERVKYWMSFGAKPSDTLATLLKNDGVEGMEEYIGPRNKQRKKKGAEDSASEASTPAASAEAAPAAEAPKTEEAPKEEEKPAEEPKAEEAPAEEPPKEEEKPAEETPKE
ncbi:30S ribosomal protein S16 [Candidatus Peregrinibacteria bacterium]|jgi:small subunit ribosomal protein S16|nr:30S ribosomal protein S16 [Candidatus Peregrinibacteria bacterium]MBT4056455.1 30S ribosomal protein S16 [Candidatus Peregrinibacteria bacterium]